MLLNSSNLLDLPVGHPVSLVLQVAESPGKVINELRSPWRGNRSGSSQNDPFRGATKGFGGERVEK